MTEIEFTFIIERDEDEGFITRCLELKGIYGQCNTEKDALEVIQRALDVALDYYQEKKLAIPFRKFVQVKRNVPSATTST